jgi:hypothetical protein
MLLGRVVLEQLRRPRQVSLAGAVALGQLQHLAATEVPPLVNPVLLPGFQL